jgi:hypothetical protein
VIQFGLTLGFAGNHRDAKDIKVLDLSWDADTFEYFGDRSKPFEIGVVVP